MGFCNKCGDILTSSTCKCGGSKKDVDIGLNSSHNQTSNAYLSLGFRGGVEAGLKTMLHGDDNVNLKCYGCAKVLPNPDMVFPDPEQELPHCEACYSKKWSKGACKVCQKPVLGMGKEWVKEGKDLFHKQCYKAKTCSKCSKEVFGGAVGVDDLVFHKDCFACEICSSGLGNTQFTVKGKTLVCINCSSTLQKSVQASNSNPSQGNKGIQKVGGGNQEPIIYRCGEGKETCKKCKKIFSATEQTLQFDGGLIHASCLKCDSCQKVLDNNAGFVRAGDKIYHQACSKISIPDQPVCAECNKPLASAFMTFEGRKMHSKCFKCFKCGKELAKLPFGKFHDDVACEACLNQELIREQQASRTVANDGDKKAGFTVNPITGKKEVRDQVYADNLANNLNQLNLTSKSKVCPFCNKAIFPGDMVPGPGVSSWHQNCLKCIVCKKQLDSLAKLKDENPYCSSCFLKK